MGFEPQTLEECRKYRYGVWAGNSGGHRYEAKQCAAEVPMYRESMLYKQCTRPNGYGSENLWCRQHARRHPPRQET
jgi:hypothetical protein